MSLSKAMIEIVRARYHEPAHAAALVELLDAYARDPAGGGEALSEFARTNLVAELATRPFIFSVLAFEDGAAVGLINAIEGFSTFACRPLVNIHDVVVLPGHRRRGVAAQMFAEGRSHRTRARRLQANSGGPRGQCGCPVSLPTAGFFSLPAHR